jgi:hypothetical protein
MSGKTRAFLVILFLAAILYIPFKMWGGRSFYFLISAICGLIGLLEGLDQKCTSIKDVKISPEFGCAGPVGIAFVALVANGIINLNKSRHEQSGGDFLGIAISGVVALFVAFVIGVFVSWLQRKPWQKSPGNANR